MFVCGFFGSILESSVYVVEGEAIAVRYAEFFALVDVSKGIVDDQVSIEIPSPADVLMRARVVEH